MKRVADQRGRALARVHCLKKDLGLDDDQYRDLLDRVIGVRSAAQLNVQQLGKVIEEMKRLAGPRSYPGRPHNANAGSRQGLVRKLEAMLADDAKPWAYAAAIGKRMFGVERVEFLDEKQLRAVIAALWHDRKRRRERGEVTEA